MGKLFNEVDYKMKIRLYDTNFSHHAPGSSVSSFPGCDVFPKNIQWIRDPSIYTDIAFFTDNQIDDVFNCDAKYKIAWVIEPREFVPSVYNKIISPNMYNNFDMILTHDEDLLKLGPNLKNK